MFTKKDPLAYYTGLIPIGMLEVVILCLFELLVLIKVTEDGRRHNTRPKCAYVPQLEGIEVTGIAKMPDI